MQPIKWQQVTDTPEMSPESFSEYKNEEVGLLTRVALNLRPFARPSDINRGKDFYFCISCRKEDKLRMQTIFQKYNSNQSIESTSTRYEEEIGFIAWMPLNDQSRNSLDQIFQTITDVEKLGDKGMPQEISEELRRKVNGYLDVVVPTNAEKSTGDLHVSSS